MKVLVTRDSFAEVTRLLSERTILSLDTETTGLSPYRGDRLFSIMIGDANDQYYFNFNPKDAQHAILDRDCIAELLPGSHNIFLHNAKFDMHFLYQEGLDLTDERFTIHCTQAIGRIVENDLPNYSLDYLAGKIGYGKSNIVKEYALKNKLWEWETTPGKKKRTKKIFYDQVPFNIIFEYGCRDAGITYHLGTHQIVEMNKMAAGNFNKGIKVWDVVDQERKLTKVLFNMERKGVKVDADYAKRARDFEQENIRRCEAEFLACTGTPFKDSNKALATAFDKLGEGYPRTEKGNPSFKDDVLESMTTPLANIVQRYRNAYKKANTYYANFLQLCDSNGVIHTNFRQSGTATGRMSCSDPNLQNLNKSEEAAEFMIRKCFVPRTGYNFVMIDYDQMEYRMMLDYAGEMEVINKVLGGTDVHTATAEIMGVTRKEAKTINFMLLYGGGIQKLADALGCSYDEAAEKRKNYFKKLPNVSGFIKGLVSEVGINENCFNWLGRIYKFKDTNFSYKAPNYLIQGGCADVVKKAMVEIDEYLRGKKSEMILQIHDEVLLEVAEDEMYIIPQVKQIMEQAYVPDYLPLTVGVEYSDTSWQEKEVYESTRYI